ncbi:SDR family NAD(P)-dependent oxidoreductase [Cecembia lonarensis]|uniref:3-oxoacyl-[acyl-carrier-protein] reductase FabG n=1 Tax=Cecembia lonarensis (strain CCUG 58316 / KCTC 22772 / LW9) TaxID=1225176 RepID=K1L9G7_CECL9|nr:SDR family NAD(P)-dependent oxidoreductase [Cecembia lonarensis]EKB51246.1 3-oxoacyl-[acyl-carrier-protein] reductase FabG [Cecembia lonarensis LW9]
MKTSKQVVWITGASSGIGREMALQYGAKNYAVAVSARRMDLLDALVKEIVKQGGDAFAVFCDVTDESSIQRAISQIVDQYGKIDIAVANAGGGVIEFLENLSREEWTRQLAINVIGLAMTVKYVLPELKKTKGRLVLIGSIAAYIPNPYLSAYGASKAAVHNIGESLQVELLGTGVTCTTIHPGFVDSNITRVDNKGHFNPNAKDPRPSNLMWPTDKAVKDMIRAIDKRKKLAVITGHGKVFVFLGRFFPRLARVMMAKQIKEISKSL